MPGQTQSASLHLGTGTKGPSLGDEFGYAEDPYIHGKKVGEHAADRSLLQSTGIWRDVYGVLLQRRERNDLQRALVSRCQDHRRRSAVEMSS
jgi:hypothetical protein